MQKRLQILGDVGTPLPTVTEKDDGKVLKAQNGNWIADEEEKSRALTNLEIEALINSFTE